jgi:hypothetical protein
MFKRKLARRAPDPERDELKRLIRSAETVPPPMKALAVVGVNQMTPAQVHDAVALFPILLKAAQDGDRETIRRTLLDQGLDDATVDDALRYYDMMANL